METRIQYQDIDGVGSWLLVSRSGHVLFEAETAEDIRQIRDCLTARLASPAEPASPQPTHEFSARPVALDWPRPRRMVWALRATLALLALAATLPFWPAGWRSLVAAVDQAGSPARAQAGDRTVSRLPPAPVWPALAQRRVAVGAADQAPSQKAPQENLVAVWETELREETYTIRRPVVETSYRDEPYTAYEPVTTWRSEQVDQGAWVRVQTPPAQGRARLRWTRGGWTTDARTGASVWMLPMPRMVREPLPESVSTQRVWQPRMVTVKTPEVTYAPRVRTHKVPVETVRYVTEKAVRSVPVKVCRMVQRDAQPQTRPPREQPANQELPMSSLVETRRPSAAADAADQDRQRASTTSRAPAPRPRPIALPVSIATPGFDASQVGSAPAAELATY